MASNARRARRAAAANGSGDGVAVLAAAPGGGADAPAAAAAVAPAAATGAGVGVQQPDTFVTEFLTIFTIMWIWLMIASGLRFVFHAEMRLIPVVFSLSFVAVGHLLLIGPADQRFALGKWQLRNKLRSTLWFLLSVPYMVLTLLDSDFLPEKLRAYVEKVTLSEIWIVMFLIALFLFSLMLMDYCYATDKQSNVSPLPATTKWAMFVTLLLIFGSNYYDEYAEHSCVLHKGQEYLPKDFSQDFQNYLGSVIADDVQASAHLNVKSAAKSTAQRSVHPKAHGCVRATFRVDKRLPYRFRVGTFQEGAEFPAWVRFSNGAHGVQSDAASDVRGMAVKLMGVDGPKLLHSDAAFAASAGAAAKRVEQNTHDLLSVSSSTFPVNDAMSYDAFLFAIASPNPLILLKYIFPSLWPFHWRLRFLYTAFTNNRAGALINNPLTTSYFSTTPYQYGSNGAVKFQFRPCVVNPNRLAHDTANRVGDNFLREALRRHLDPDTQYPASWGLDETCFEFLVQEQRQPCREPIEDPTREWRGPWVRIGLLSIPKQQFLARDQMVFCDALRYNPWHAPEQHKPLGAVNIARKMTYWQGGATRNALNGDAQPEPTGAEKFSGQQLPAPWVGKGDPVKFEFSRYDQPFHDLPRKVKVFPPELGFSGAKTKRMAENLLGVNKEYIAREHATNVKHFENYTSPDDYVHLLSEHTWNSISPFAYRLHNIWKSDAEYARGFVSGVNPMAIHNPAGLDGTLPAAFSPNAEEAARIAAVAGATVEELLSAKRLFYADYHVLHDIDMTQGRIFYAPIVLLYVTDGAKGPKRLMPLAIQLTRSTTRHNRIFTPPKDSATADPYASNEGLVWLFAKMHAASADGQVHEMISHLLLTHLAMEPIIVGFYRQFAPTHDLFQLMLPHFFETLAINNLGRNTLLAAPATSDFERVSSVGIRGSLQLMQQVYVKHYSLSRFRYSNELKSRGFSTDSSGAADGLPDYLYRDYASLVWSAMHDYVEAVVSKLYPTDAAVANDESIQGLVRELYDPDLGGIPFDADRPKEDLTTRANLIDFLSQVMYTCSAGHSVVNFGQFDYYAFIPNRPFHLTKPMPDDTALVTMQYIMQALPQKERSQEIITLARTLTLLEPTGLLDDVEQQQGLFAIRARFPDASKAFVAKLKTIERTIKERNAKLENVQFPYLEPKQIMPSISI